MEPITLANGRQVKLGRIRPTTPPRCLKFEAYLEHGAPKQAPPPSLDYFTKAMPAIKRMYANDRYGCCVISRQYHQHGLWTANDSSEGEKPPALGTDAEVIDAYHRICGPGDNGCMISEVLDYARDHGVPLNGVTHKIDGYVSVDNTNKAAVQTAMTLFGSLSLGIDLPGTWTSTDSDWLPSNARIVGGHDVCTVGYDDFGVKVATWGGISRIRWDAFLSRKWIQECYAILAPDWYGNDQLAVYGLNVEKLKADLANLGGGGVPPIPDPIPPTPPTPPQPPLPPIPGVQVATLNSDVRKGSYFLLPMGGANLGSADEVGGRAVSFSQWIQIVFLVMATLQKPITPETIMALIAAIQQILGLHEPVNS